MSKTNVRHVRTGSHTHKLRRYLLVVLRRTWRPHHGGPHQLSQKFTDGRTQGKGKRRRSGRMGHMEVSVSSIDFETQPGLRDVNLGERTVLIRHHFSRICTARRIEDRTWSLKRDCFQLDAERVDVTSRCYESMLFLHCAEIRRPSQTQ